MKKRKHINLIFLVFVHLILFTYPMVSKSLHMHEKKEECCTECHQQGPAITQQAETCLICDFELLSFVAEAEFKPTVYPVAFPVLVLTLPEKIHTAPILHFSLRAPPTT
jgi:hypothetical protein